MLESLSKVRGAMLPPPQPDRVKSFDVRRLIVIRGNYKLLITLGKTVVFCWRQIYIVVVYQCTTCVLMASRGNSSSFVMQGMQSIV